MMHIHSSSNDRQGRDFIPWSRVFSNVENFTQQLTNYKRLYLDPKINNYSHFECLFICECAFAHYIAFNDWIPGVKHILHPETSSAQLTKRRRAASWPVQTFQKLLHYINIILKVLIIHCFGIGQAAVLMQYFSVKAFEKGSNTICLYPTNVLWQIDLGGNIITA